jgi:asparagine synthase (glutamine-hydrolysing)
MMADVPLGAFLSGGVDSTIIVSAMAQDAATPVHTFSMGFADRSYNELPFAREVATRFGTVHREEQVTPDIVGLAEKLADTYDEPFGDVSAFPTYLLATVARRDVTVALSGDGGDELFAGYDFYRAHRWASRIRTITSSFGWRAVDRLLEGMPPRPEKKGAVNKAKRFEEGLRKPEDLEHARWLVFWDLAERRALYTAEAQAADEAFSTAASIFVMPVVEVDGKAVGTGKPGPVATRLRERYYEHFAMILFMQDVDVLRPEKF